MGKENKQKTVVTNGMEKTVECNTKWENNLWYNGKFSHCIRPDSTFDLGANFLSPVMNIMPDTVPNVCPKSINRL